MKLDDASAAAAYSGQTQYIDPTSILRGNVEDQYDLICLPKRNGSSFSSTHGVIIA